MEKDISKILSMLIELSMQSDCEQFNMGDCTGQELEDTLADKQAWVAKLKRSKTALKTVPVELIYQGVHDLALYLRVFGPEEGLDLLRKAEHTLARHILISRVEADAKKKFQADPPKHRKPAPVPMPSDGEPILKRPRPAIPREPVRPEIIVGDEPRKPRKIK